MKKLLSVLTVLGLVCFGLFLSIAPLLSSTESGNDKSQALGVYVETERNFSFEMPKNSADSAIVIDGDSLSVIYAKNENMIRGMASTTKIMTALVAIENCPLDAEFVIPKEAVGVEGSSVYLIEGEKLNLEELLYCLLLESGNDAAAAIAVCVGGSVENFVEMMNQRAEELGLENTHFANPHGLSHNEHCTTAKELAVITAEAMKYPDFNRIISTKTASVRYDGVKNGRVLTNHNKLLGSYEGATGVKTGYTDKDGKCLVSSASRNGLNLIAVTLDDPSPAATHKLLLDSAFGNFSRVTVAKEGEINALVTVNGGESGFVAVSNTREISICIPKGEAFEIELDLPRSVDAPVSEGDLIGKALVKSGGDEVYIIDLEATENIKEHKKSFWEKFFGK